MCGFILTNFQKIKSENTFLQHRGPDNSGYFSDNHIRIIFNRLSIIDLDQAANQPMKYENFIIVFNGEIFNYIEIKNDLKKKGYSFKTKSDTEVLLKSYIEWGEKCLEKIEGMFAFSIYNVITHEIFVARDPFGIKPIFFYKNDNQFIITSEKKAIFKFNVKKEINEKTLANYLGNGIYQHDENTFYKNIYSLTPGSFLKIKNNKFYFFKWFELKKEINSKISYQDAKHELNNLLKESIKLCSRSDRKISIACSGGLDSSSIIMESLKLDINKNIEYLLHWTCRDEYNEELYAKEISKISKIKLLTSVLKKSEFNKYLKKCILSVEEPIGGLNTISSRKIFENLKRKNVPVILDGNGSDEILGGYQQHINAHNKNFLDYNSQPVQGLNINYHTEILSKNYKSLIDKFYVKKKFDDPLKDSMFNDLTGSKLRRTLIQQDHNSMSNSIEIRFPFLNKKLVNFCYSLPGKYLINNNLGKYILRDLYKDKLLWEPKRAQQTPQIKWLNEFIINDLINSLKKEKIFFDYKIFDKKKLINRLIYWQKNKKTDSVFPWQVLMTYNFIKYCL
jgi:asparagine synthase (glutamine-hydrolysing)